MPEVDEFILPKLATNGKLDNLREYLAYLETLPPQSYLGNIACALQYASANGCNQHLEVLLQSHVILKWLGKKNNIIYLGKTLVEAFDHSHSLIDPNKRIKEGQNKCAALILGNRNLFKSLVAIESSAHYLGQCLEKSVQILSCSSQGNHDGKKRRLGQTHLASFNMLVEDERVLKAIISNSPHSLGNALCLASDPKFEHPIFVQKLMADPKIVMAVAKYSPNSFARSAYIGDNVSEAVLKACWKEPMAWRALKRHTSSNKLRDFISGMEFSAALSAEEAGESRRLAAESRERL